MRSPAARAGSGWSDVSRRQVLGGLATAAAALVLVRPTRAAALVLRSSAGVENDLTLARFTPHLGSEFLVRSGETRLRATLVEADAHVPHAADRPGLRGEAFSLVFASATAAPIGRTSSTLVHPVLGTFPLFLSPIESGRKTNRYEAVIDRRLPAV